jgi:class 3 adenylate cyclase
MTQELPEGTVTILFTDVVGSTELTTRIGDEAAREVLGGCDDLVRQQFERHRGHEVKGTGDGLMVAFTSGAPRGGVCHRHPAGDCRARSQRRGARGWSAHRSDTGEVVREEEDLFGGDGERRRAHRGRR